MKLFFVFLFLFFSCDNKLERAGRSVSDYVDNEIIGNPIVIEISDLEKISMKIQSDTLYKYNSGNTVMFGGVYADLFDDSGKKSSEMHSDTATIYNNSDSVRANGNIIVKSIRGYTLHTSEIILYNDTKLVYSNKDVIFTSDRNDTLYGNGFWSNYDMSNFKILKPMGIISN